MRRTRVARPGLLPAWLAENPSVGVQSLLVSLAAATADMAASLTRDAAAPADGDDDDAAADAATGAAPAPPTPPAPQ